MSKSHHSSKRQQASELDQRLQQAIRQHRAGNLAAAQRKCRSILQQAPKHRETLQLLAILMQQSGNSRSALHFMQKALKTDPENPDLLKNLAEIYRGSGDLQQAQRYAQKALDVAADHVDSLFVSAAVYLQQDEADKALLQFTRLIAIDPDDCAARNELANLLSAKNRLDEAIHHYREALLRQPDFVDCRCNLADTLLQAGALDAAIEEYQRVLETRPDNARLHNSLGLAFTRKRDLDRALSCFELALEQDPLHLSARLNLGKLALERDPHLAENWFKSVLDIDPRYAEGYYWLGVLFQTLGKFDRATNYLQQAIRLDPEFVFAWYRLSLDRDFRVSAPHLQMLEEQITCRAANEEDDDEQISLGFTLGRFHEQHGNHVQAFRYFQQANRIKVRRHPFDRAIHEAQIDEVINRFDAEFYRPRATWGSPSELPIFVVGMPRSGTTLIEQILASHPDVHGAGELRLMQQLNASLTADPASPAHDQARPAELDPRRVSAMARQYLAHLQGLDPQAKRVVDKLPGNYFRLGLIHLLFPRARIVHCQRDAMDTCWSCYQQNFEEGLYFSNDLESLGHAYRGYQRLMAHWQRVFPDQILNLAYEDLVQDPEPTSRLLLQHCGIDWQPGVLDFQQLHRPVTTASLWQVRQPLYHSSIGRWKPYKPYLQLLERSLAG